MHPRFCVVFGVFGIWGYPHEGQLFPWCLPLATSGPSHMTVDALKDEIKTTIGVPALVSGGKEKLVAIVESLRQGRIFPLTIKRLPFETSLWCGDDDMKNRPPIVRWSGLRAIELDRDCTNPDGGAVSPIAGGLLVPAIDAVYEGPVRRVMSEHVKQLAEGDIIISVNGRSVYTARPAGVDMIKFPTTRNGGGDLELVVFDRTGSVREPPDAEWVGIYEGDAQVQLNELKYYEQLIRKRPDMDPDLAVKRVSLDMIGRQFTDAETPDITWVIFDVYFNDHEYNRVMVKCYNTAEHQTTPTDESDHEHYALNHIMTYPGMELRPPEQAAVTEEQVSELTLHREKRIKENNAFLESIGLGNGLVAAAAAETEPATTTATATPTAEAATATTTTGTEASTTTARTEVAPRCTAMPHTWLGIF